MGQGCKHQAQGMQTELPSQAKAVKAVSSAVSHKQGAPGMLGVGPWEILPHAHNINKSPGLSSIYLSSSSLQTQEVSSEVHMVHVGAC